MRLPSDNSRVFEYLLDHINMLLWNYNTSQIIYSIMKSKGDFLANFTLSQLLTRNLYCVIFKTHVSPGYYTPTYRPKLETYSSSNSPGV